MNAYRSLPEASAHTVEATKLVLDAFGVAQRLRHVRDFIWRGGEIGLRVERDQDGLVRDVAYELRAAWDTAVLESSLATNGLERHQQAVVEGRWVRARRGYVLAVGIDLRVPSAIYVRADRPFSSVPFLRRPTIQVNKALADDLSAYVEAFLNHCPSVPEAEARDRRRYSQLGDVTQIT